MNWRQQFEVSHSIEKNTDDVLVLRHHWQGAVALGIVVAILGSPIIIASLRTTDPANRLALSLLSIVCPGAGLALAAYGWAKRNSLTIVDRTAQTIRWGSGRPIPFAEIERIMLRTKQNLEGTDSRGRTSHGISFELVVILSSGRERKVITGIRREQLAPVAENLQRLTAGHRIPMSG